MNDVSLILSRLDLVENNLRGDIGKVHERITMLEVSHGRHDERIKQVEDKCKSFSGGCRQAGKDAHKDGPGILGRCLTFLGVLTEAPRLWHIIVAIATLVLTLTAFAAKHIP